MSIASTINDESYGNLGNLHNPILKQILQQLENSGLISETLNPTNTSRTTEPDKGGIQIYKNANEYENSAVAIEVLVDAISRGVLLGLQEGFEQGIKPAVIKSDSASNIQFSTNVAEDLLLLKMDLKSSTSVHEALVQIAQEINAIKVGLQGLGVTLPNIPAIPSIKVMLD